MSAIRCKGRHRFLSVDEFNALGAVCSCLICDMTFQLGAEEMETHYYSFIHHSAQGPEEDMEMLILDKVLDG